MIPQVESVLRLTYMERSRCVALCRSYNAKNKTKMSDQNEDKPPPSEPPAPADPPQTTQPSTSSVNLPPATGVVWRLQYVPTVVFGDGTR